MHIKHKMVAWNGGVLSQIMSKTLNLVYSIKCRYNKEKKRKSI